jgi:anti-sigma regulatory factor (Ser/Thr protein kinase)
MHRYLAAPASLHLEVPAHRDSVAIARHAVRDHCSLGDAAGEDVITVISELLCNAVTHAGLRPTDEVSLDVRYGSSSVMVEVTDHGPGFDGTLAVDPDERGGFGLRIVAALSTAWGSLPDSGTVWAEVPC